MATAIDMLTQEQRDHIDTLVKHYLDNKMLYGMFFDGLASVVNRSEELNKLLHSSKFRLKTPESLRKKLALKWLYKTHKGEEFDYTVENLFLKVNDLAACRLIHLHTTQFREIHVALQKALADGRLKLFEVPSARIWDEDMKAVYEDMGVKTEVNLRMYSSVHYIATVDSGSPVTGEIQVRTLADELWGEVDHSINYPEEHGSPSCRQQLRVLARLASSCSRLVDSIMLSHRLWEEENSHKVKDGLKDTAK